MKSAMNARQAMRRGALALGAFALVTAGSVGAIRALTAEQISRNAQVYQHQQLQKVLPPALENVATEKILQGAFNLPDAQQLGHRQPTQGFTISNPDTSIVILPVVTREGYNGEIRLWVSINRTGQITGVRVSEHQETPGLGDKIERRRSDWITRFDGLSLDSLPPQSWAVKKEGGQFDAFTGATITPRAVIQAVYQALVYAQQTAWPYLQERSETRQQDVTP
ncbi:electron transport complex subunit RsxG [Halomonas sp. LS-001]